MQRLILHTVAGLLKAAGAMVRVVPVKRRVAFLSRQGSRVPLDFQLLIERWRHEGRDIPVELCLTEPETKGVLQFMGNTLRQLRLAQTSSVVVVDGYVPAVSVPYKRKGVTVVEMWHAMGAMKKFGYQCLDTPHGRSADSARILKMHRNYDHVVVGAKWTAGYFREAFDCDEAVIEPLGLPRLDYLTAGEFAACREQVRRELLEAFPHLANGQPNVVYAPTFRRGVASFAYRQVTAARDVLAQMPCNLIVTGHPLDEEGEGCPLPPNVLMGLGRKTIDLLLVADALVTDYSAVTYEAIAAGVPVFFFAPDIDEYRESPGLNVDPAVRFPDRFSAELPEAVQMAMQRLDEPMANLHFPEHCIDSITSLLEVKLGS